MHAIIADGRLRPRIILMQALEANGHTVLTAAGSDQLIGWLKSRPKTDLVIIDASAIESKKLEIDFVGILGEIRCTTVARILVVIEKDLPPEHCTELANLQIEMVFSAELYMKLATDGLIQILLETKKEP